MYIYMIYIIYNIYITKYILGYIYIYIDFALVALISGYLVAGVLVSGFLVSWSFRDWFRYWFRSVFGCFRVVLGWSWTFLSALDLGILVTGALWPALVSQPLKRIFLRRFEAPLKHIFELKVSTWMWHACFVKNVVFSRFWASLVFKSGFCWSRLWNVLF